MRRVVLVEPEMVEACPCCGDDAYLGSPQAKPTAPDFREYDCGSCGFQFVPGPRHRRRWVPCRRCGILPHDHPSCPFTDPEAAS